MNSWQDVADEWKQRIADCLSGLEYGSLQIVVHDGQIVQIERIERHRFDLQKAREHKEASARTAARNASQRRNDKLALTGQPEG